MNRSVRPSTPADASAIKTLFAQTGLRPNVELQSLHWKYWQERSDWRAPRSFVLARGEKLLAHGAIIPGAFLVAGDRIPTAHVTDWAARPGEIGAGVALMKYLAQQVGTLFAVGGSEDTRRILPYMGFRSAGVATDYQRPLFPLRSLRSFDTLGWRVLPRAARAVLRTLAARRATRGDWSTQRLSTDSELQGLAAVFPVSNPKMTVLERNAGMFSYQLTCPIARMQLFAAQHAAGAQGYFLLSSTPGQVRIADCWINSEKIDEWRALLLCAFAQAREDSQAVEIVMRASDPILRSGLVQAGFRVSGEAPISVRPAAGFTVPTVDLRIQMLDNDAAFFHEAA